jgi:hypothetical protein
VLREELEEVKNANTTSVPSKAEPV